jgi:hypothetical protein
MLGTPLSTREEPRFGQSLNIYSPSNLYYVMVSSFSRVLDIQY